MKRCGQKILYVGIPYHSHVNPALGIIKGLVDSGHQVLFQGVGKLSKELESLGAKNLSSPTDFLFNPDPQTITSPLKIVPDILEANSKIIPLVNKIIKQEQPNLIIHDHFCPWGKIVARQNNLPAVSLVTILALSNPLLLLNWRILTSGMHVSLRDLLKVPKLVSDLVTLRQNDQLGQFKIADLFVNPEPLTLVFTSKLFQPFGETFDPSYQFIGPSIYPRGEETISGWHKDPKRKTLYLCLGTMHGTLKLYKKCLEALQNSPHQILVSVGNRVNVKDLGRVPSNIQVRNFVPQLKILQKVDASISHGGMNSVNESLYFGVPLVMIPLLNEQVINSSRVQELGAGIMLDKNHVNPDTLTQAIQKVLTDDNFKKNAHKIQDSLRDAGGYKRGVEEINRYLCA